MIARKPFTLALALCASLFVPGAALAAPSAAGGASPEAASSSSSTPKPAEAQPAAAPAPALPVEPLRSGSTTCRSGCLGLDAGVPGSVVRLVADGLAGASALVFLGGEGTSDDVAVPPAAAAGAVIDAVVPEGAATGPLAVLFADGRVAKATSRPFTVGGPAAEVVQARVASRKLFFGARRRPTLDVFVPAGPPQAIGADVVRLSDGVAIARVDAGEVAGGSVVSLEWTGVAGGRVQRDGRYAFRLGVPAQMVSRQASEGAPPPPAEPASGIAPEAAFEFLRHEFPIRGTSRFGTGPATFGGGRGHQGFDVFAACGTPMVAARGGVVKFAGSHVRAGNYLVIDGAGEGFDHAYMHLQQPVAFAKGDVVATGQPIGAVGDTGRASGCHLHFEIWKSPGWYSGGAPIDPLPMLRSWAAQSGTSATRRAARSTRSSRAVRGAHAGHGH